MLRLVALDSGPLAALFIPDDPFHEKATTFIGEIRVPTFTTVPVITEVMYLLDFSSRNQCRFLEWLHRGAVEIATLEASDWERTSQLIAKYADLPADFADVTLIAVSERRQTRRIATIDSDFDVYRYNDRHPFVNLFPR